MGIIQLFCPIPSVTVFDQTIRSFGNIVIGLIQSLANVIGL